MAMLTARQNPPILTGDRRCGMMEIYGRRMDKLKERR